MRDKGFRGRSASVKRFILRFRATGPMPGEHIHRVCGLPSTTVLDYSPRMLLVEGPEPELKALVASMPGWVMSPEQMIGVPNPRLKPRRRRKERK